MKLSEIRKAYEDLSSTLSAVLRSLNFSGIAVIWIFSGNSINTILASFLSPCILLCLSLFVDAIQYFVGTLIWYIYYLKVRCRNEGADEDTVMVNESENLNILPWILFGCKTILCFTGYCTLLLRLVVMLISNFVSRT